MTKTDQALSSLSPKRIARFRAKISAPNADGCCLWTGGVNSSGYGQFGVGPVMASAHRIAFTLATGGLPPSGTVVMHTCDNTRCCNPDHLRLGTHDANMSDMAEKGRGANTKLVCIGGITRTRRQWAKCLGLSKSGFVQRVRRGAITPDNMAGRSATVDGRHSSSVQQACAWLQCRGGNARGVGPERCTAPRKNCPSFSTKRISADQVST